MASTPQETSSTSVENVTESSYQPPPGRVGNLSVIQQHTLQKLKNEMQAEGEHLLFHFYGSAIDVCHIGWLGVGIRVYLPIEAGIVCFVVLAHLCHVG